MSLLTAEEQHYLREDMKRLLVTAVVVALVMIAIAYLAHRFAI